MCFSAQASFAAAAGLSILSLLSIKKAHNTKMLALAASPLFFAVQQACEGIVWLTLTTHDTTSMLHKIGMYGFLFFAGTWWPIWVSVALCIPEKIHKRKKLLLFTLIIGVTTAIVLFCAWTLQTEGAEVVSHRLNYPVQNYPFGITNTYIAQLISWIIALSYAIAAIAPFFISSIAYVWMIGIVIGIGMIVAYIFYFAAFPSVWCFFAAISSALLYCVIEAHHKKSKLLKQ
jgi:hypothetical protein